MRLLILGGTAFVGRHLVEAALARGHAVTLFNRGMRNPELFADLERLQGERPDNLAANGHVQLIVVGSKLPAPAPAGFGDGA